MAESIRLAVRARPVVSDGVSIKVTASLGVSSIEAGSPLKSLPHLIKAADLALYTAKKSGRNCVKVFSPPPVKAQAKPAA